MWELMFALKKLKWYSYPAFISPQQTLDRNIDLRQKNDTIPQSFAGSILNMVKRHQKACVFNCYKIILASNTEPKTKNVSEQWKAHVDWWNWKMKSRIKCKKNIQFLKARKILYFYPHNNTTALKSIRYYEVILFYFWNWRNIYIYGLAKVEESLNTIEKTII